MREMESVCPYGGCMHASFQGAWTDLVDRAGIMCCRHVSTFMASGFMSREFEHRLYIVTTCTRTCIFQTFLTADQDEEINWGDVPERMIRKTKKRAEGRRSQRFYNKHSLINVAIGPLSDSLLK